MPGRAWQGRLEYLARLDRVGHPVLPEQLEQVGVGDGEGGGGEVGDGDVLHMATQAAERAG